MVFSIEVIERTHNGNEYRAHKLFQTLEAASGYLQKKVNCYCTDFDLPDSWDAQDMGGAAPPNKITVAVARLQQLLATQKQTPIRVYGPESQFAGNRPFEILIEELDMEA